MKKTISFILAAVLAALCLIGCAATANTQSTNTASSGTSEIRGTPIKIVATIFPAYDWAKEMLGENAENADLTLLLDSGVDLHSYQPTADDILKISDCDLFIYVGGGSDTWVEDALQEATNKNMKTIDLCEVLGDTVRQEEQIEGMENSHANEHANDPEADHVDHHHTDEHVWLSLRNSARLCQAIADALAELDPANAALYQANYDAYSEKLEALDEDYQAAVDTAAQKTLLFGDRFPFRYLVDDYGLNYYAAFTGCSAESEASFETIAFLAQKVDELGLNTVLTIEKSDGKIANAIVQNTQTKNQQILALDSMQSTTMGDVKSGATYVSIMESNLSVLKQALQ